MTPGTRVRFTHPDSPFFGREATVLRALPQQEMSGRVLLVVEFSPGSASPVCVYEGEYVEVKS